VATKTRVIDLVGGQRRGEGVNRSTVYITMSGSIFPFQVMFERAWPAMRAALQTRTDPGVAAFAVHLIKGLEGAAWIAAKPGTINAALIGRHDRADLFLHNDPALSLRHLALLVEPITSYDGDVRYRVADLRTPGAFEDETGKRLEGIVAEGPAFVRCGAYAIYFLTTGDGTPWPEQGAEAWRCIPERVYLHEDAAEPDRWQRRRGFGDSKESSSSYRRKSWITLVPGPVASHDPLVADGEDPIVRVHVDAPGHGRGELLIGERALQHGILLGCYPRCDAAHVLANPSISRVHLLLVRIGERVFAIDTASTNGTFLRANRQPVRIAQLTGGSELVLGQDLALLRWIELH
jgi:hypothetical protein